MSTPTYRLVRLGDLSIYRIEEWKKHWLSGKTKWRIVYFTRLMMSDGCESFSEFESAEDAVSYLDKLRARDAERATRRKNGWAPC